MTCRSVSALRKSSLRNPEIPHPPRRCNPAERKAPMSLILHVIDAFTDRPFSGNPAAVCVLPAPRGEAWMQLVAREMNLSETAFLHPDERGYALRWFTPAMEVNLCGHATL